MERKCLVCRKVFVLVKGPGRPRVRCESCSPVRQDRKRGGAVVAIRPPTHVADAPAGIVETLIREQLESAGVAQSVDAVAAIRAAKTIDDGVSGSAEAALLREMRAAANAALVARPAVTGSLLDQLRQRREG